jgi:hypothetical protein
VPVPYETELLPDSAALCRQRMIAGTASDRTNHISKARTVNKACMIEMWSKSSDSETGYDSGALRRYRNWERKSRRI